MQILDRPQAKGITARLFGLPEFAVRGGDPVRLAERKSRALLAYLVMHPGVASSRARLAELFWPDRMEGAGRASLRQALSSIRKAMGDEAEGTLIVTRESVMLASGRVSSDVGSLEQDSADASHTPAATPDEFLEGMTGISAELDLWISRENARLAAMRVARLRDGARHAEAEGRLAEAASLLAGAVALDPLDEELRRSQMRVLAASGRSDVALREYEALVRALQADLDVKPEPETVRLAQGIRAGRTRRDATTPAAGPLRSTTVPPVTRYARCGDLRIAYQVTGSGPVDVIFVPGWVSNVDYAWKHPRLAGFLEQLGSVCRLIRLDKRGTGLSDRGVGYPTLEERMQDVRAVMDAAGSERAVLFGTSEGGNMCMLFAATYPERTSGLILYGAFAKGLWSEDYPWAKTVEQVEAELAEIDRGWGGPFDLSNGAPSLAAEPGAADWFAEFMRQSASPADAISLWRWNTEIDVRSILPSIRVPTLVLHRTGDRWQKVEEGRYLARHIATARYREFPGDDHIIWASNAEDILAEVSAFLREEHRPTPVEDVLAALLAVSCGAEDQGAEVLVRMAEDLVREGGMVQHARGGSLVAAFGGPSIAIRCGARLLKSGEWRAAVHVGECERTDAVLRGGAVELALTMLDHASPGQMLVSQPARQLTAGIQVAWGEMDKITVADGLAPLTVYAVKGDAGS